MSTNLYIISGPAGVGKSTTSKLLVQTLEKVHTFLEMRLVTFRLKGEVNLGLIRIHTT